MTNESIILTLLSIIGCLVGTLIIYFIANTNNQFKDIKDFVKSLNDKLDDHMKDCKFIDKRS